MFYHKNENQKTSLAIPFFFLVVISCRLSYMFSTNSFHLFGKHGYALLIMIFGSFVAGSSPEGSASIAYPVFTPLGAFVVSKVPRKAVATFLYCILIIQFIGAMWVIKPNLVQTLTSLAVLATGLVSFFYLAKMKRRVPSVGV